MAGGTIFVLCVGLKNTRISEIEVEIVLIMSAHWHDFFYFLIIYDS